LKIEEKSSRLAIESLMKWAEWFPIDSQGLESEFKQKLGLLVCSQMLLPESFEFYSQSEEGKSLLLHIKEDLMSHLNFRIKVLFSFRNVRRIKEFR